MTEVGLVDDSPKLDDGVAAEDGVVWVADVYHIEGYGLRPLSIAFAKCHIQLNFVDGLNFLATEADERVLRLEQILFGQAHLDEALPGENVSGTAIVSEDAAHIVSGEVLGVFADVGPDDEEVVVGVVLESEVGFGE